MVLSTHIHADGEDAEILWTEYPASARHPRITTRRHTVRLNSAHAAGREAGRSVVLHKPVETGPSGRGTRLLRG